MIQNDDCWSDDFANDDFVTCGFVNATSSVSVLRCLFQLLSRTALRFEQEILSVQQWG